MARSANPPRSAGRSRPRRHACNQAGVRDLNGFSNRYRPRARCFQAAQALRTPAWALPPLAIFENNCLQGNGDNPSARAVLPRSFRPAFRLNARTGSLALLNQHLPVLATRSPVPNDCPQRRNQHGQRQPQLDGCAPISARLRGTGRPKGTSADRHAERFRLRVI